MKNLLFALALLPALSACPGPIVSTGAPPTIATVVEAVDDALTILDRTDVDEKAFIAALSAFDVGLTAVDGLIATKRIVPGSPFALELQGHLITAQKAFRAAKQAHNVGNGKSYASAVAAARTALKLASATLKKGN